MDETRALILLTNIVVQLNDKSFDEIKDLKDFLILEIGFTESEWDIVSQNLTKLNVVI